MVLSSRGRAILLLWALSVAANADLSASSCASPDSAVASSTWSSITSPKESVAVVYASPSGWVGLNRIYANRQAITHRRRSFIPWMMPQVNAIFAFTHALQSPANELPLFYVDHLDTAAYLNGDEAREIHLLRLKSVGNERELETTSGASVFNFAPTFSAHSVIPLKVDVLSNSILAIQPGRQLPDGQYLIVIGPVASNGFEFQINCLHPEMPTTLVRSIYR